MAGEKQWRLATNPICSQFFSLFISFISKSTDLIVDRREEVGGREKIAGVKRTTKMASADKEINSAGGPQIHSFSWVGENFTVFDV